MCSKTQVHVTHLIFNSFKYMIPWVFLRENVQSSTKKCEDSKITNTDILDLISFVVIFIQI